MLRNKISEDEVIVHQTRAVCMLGFPLVYHFNKSFLCSKRNNVQHRSLGEYGGY